MSPPRTVERARPSGGDTSAQLNAIALLLTDLIDAVQAQGGSGADSSVLGDSAMLPQSTTQALSSAALSLTHAAPNGASIKCKANFPRATPVTVTFGVDSLGVLPQASIEFKLGGNSVTRIMDVTPGCSISGFAEQVNVSCTDLTAGGYGTPPAEYNVTITIAPGTRPTTAVPPVYSALQAAAMNSAATETTAVPLGASGVQVHGVSAGGSASLRVDLYSTGAIGSTAVKIDSYETDTLSTGFVPLVAGVAQIQITNEGGSAAVVSAVFSIDG